MLGLLLDRYNVRIPSLLSRMQDEPAAPGGNVSYVRLHVNRGSAGNGIIDLEFDGAVTGTDLENFKVECREPDSIQSNTTAVWQELDPADYTSAIVDTNYIRYTPTGTIDTYQASHEFRVSLASAGDLNVNTFANDTTVTNSSTVDLLASILEIYKMSDGYSEISAAHDLDNNNTVTFASGKLENCADLENSASEDMYLSFTDGIFDSGNFTVAQWVNPETLNVHPWIQGNGVTSEMSLLITTTGEARVKFGAPNILSTTQLTTAGGWYLIGGDYDGTSQRVWVDGTEENDGIVTPVYTNDKTHFGVNAGLTGGWMDGQIDESYFYSKKLSTAEWGDLYNGGDGKSFPFIPKAKLTYIKTIVGKGGLGNQYIYVEFNNNITSPGADYEAGWTIEIQDPTDLSWNTLPAAKYTGTLYESRYIRFELTGTVKSIQKTHNIRISYDSGVGDIEDASSSEALGSITNDTNIDNRSTTDLLTSLEEIWEGDETSGNLTARFDSGKDMVDNASVGSGTGYGGETDGARDYEESSSQFHSIADAAWNSLNGQDHTWSVWVNFETVNSDNKGIISKWAGSNFQYRLILNNSDFIQYRASDNGTGQSGNAWGSTASAATWYHVVCGYEDGVELFLAVDAGTAVTTNFTGGIYDGTGDLNIGKSRASEYLDGLLDEIILWDRRLNTDEIADLYNGGNGKKYPYLPDLT